ncbi:MAG: cell division protein FtsX [Nevskia sp.]|nr:cell division protein FtsX [Nevskia sp.]
MVTAKSPQSAAQVATQPSWLSRTLQDHSRALNASLTQLMRKPIATLLTAFVIGLTLALPAGLDTVLRNLDVVGDSLQGSMRASLFLKDSVDADRAQELSRSLGKRPGVANARYISREQALEEFKQHSGFGEALDLLKDNPLPAVIVVTPDHHAPQAQTSALLKELSNLPEVEQAQLDEKWLQRLYAILDLVQRAVLVIAAALALAVVIVIANTIRLDIERHREEIEVMKLIGAPDGFIRRPFLYTGLGYGLVGALLACAMVAGAGMLLAPPAHELAGLYDAEPALRGLAPEAVLAVFGAALVLGWLGAFWTVSRHLHQIEPD